MINVFFEDNEIGQYNKMVVFFLFLGLMLIFIVVINCFVVFLVWKKKVFCILVNIFLISFVCVDFFLGFCVILLIIVCQFLEICYLWSGFFCLSMDFISRMLLIFFIFYLLVIVVERYVVIVCYVKLDDFVSCKKYVVIVFVLWFIFLFVFFI